MFNHTQCVNNLSGARRHQQFCSPYFSWAGGIRAMRCIRMALGVVVEQLGQLGIGCLTIASFLLLILYFGFVWKTRCCEQAVALQALLAVVVAGILQSAW